MEQKKDLIEHHLEEWNEERPDLDASALATVNRISLLAKRFHRQTRKALRPFGLELWEYDVLASLRRQGKPYELPPTALAKLAMLTTGAMTNRIDRLEKKELVERWPAPEDRRSISVQLTGKGLELIDRAVAARMHSASGLVDSLSSSEAVALEGLLKKLVLSSEHHSPR